jgi:hypothetical protein
MSLGSTWSASFAMGLYTGTWIMYMWLEGREILVCQEYCCMWLERTKLSMDTVEKFVLTLLYFIIKISRKEFKIVEIWNTKRLNNLVYERAFMLTERNFDLTLQITHLRHVVYIVALSVTVKSVRSTANARRFNCSQIRGTAWASGFLFLPVWP